MSDQAKRIRSPNYPVISLPAAVARLPGLFERINKHAAPAEAVAKALGYGGWNGSSGSVVSAHTKYGLLERVDDQRFKITDRAMRIMFGTSPSETGAALREAALAPPLYGELTVEFGEPVPHDDILRPWLIRRGFAPSAVAAVIQGYRDTMELVRTSSQGYDSATQPPVEQAMQPVTATHPVGHVTPIPPVIARQEPLSSVGRQEKIADDYGNEIVLAFPSEPTLETYEFVKEYLEFRIARLKKTAKLALDEILS